MEGNVYRTVRMAERAYPGAMVQMYRGRGYLATSIPEEHRDRRGRRWLKWRRGVPVGIICGIAAPDTATVQTRGYAWFRVEM